MNRILAIYRDQSRAALATRELEACGIAPEQISLMAADSASGQLFMAKQRCMSNASTVAVAKTAIGSTDNLVPGSRLDIGVIFTGPIAQLYEANANGGLLVQLGIPASEVVLRSREILDGAILVAIDTEDSAHRSVTDALGSMDYLQVIQGPSSKA